MTAQGSEANLATIGSRAAGPAVRATRPPPSAKAPWVGAEPPQRLVIAAAAAVLVLAATLEILVRGEVGLLTGLSLVLVSIGAALLMRPAELFTAGILPPLLTLGLLIGIAVVFPQGIGVRSLDPAAGTAQVAIAGFVDLAGALVVAHALALLLVGMRIRATRLRAARR